MTRTDLPEAAVFLRRWFPGGGRVLCAVSGGLDSMCLVDYMSRAAGFTVAAAHFHHGLRGAEADRDEEFVQSWCAERGIPCLSGRGDTRALAAEQGLSLEEAARRLRYAFLEKTAAEGGFDAVFTAHHADDNAETVLLNLIRGTGPQGLAGIPAVRGRIYRPFLRIPRAALADYAALRGLPHVEDSTNSDPGAAARNALRSAVTPVLRQINPRYAENIGRMGEILRRESEAVETMAAALVRQAEDLPDGWVIPCQVLRSAPEAAAERAVLRLLEKTGGHRKDLGAAHVRAVLALCAPERVTGQRSLPYGVLAQRTGKTLILRRGSSPAADAALMRGGTVDFGRWRVTAAAAPGALAVAAGPAAELRVTHWRSDDRLRLPGSRGARSFKRLCADRGITPAERDALPVLRVNGVHAADPVFGVSMDFTPQEQDAAVFVKFYQKAEENDYEK